MKKLVEAFIERVNSKEHIGIFIEKASLTLKIQSDNDYLTLIFSNGNISIDIAGQKSENPDVLISGSYESLSLILEGKEILRTAEKTGNIKIFSTFRNTLFLETLFILVKNDDKTNSFNQKFQIMY